MTRAAQGLETDGGCRDLWPETTGRTLRVLWLDLKRFQKTNSVDNLQKYRDKALRYWDRALKILRQGIQNTETELPYEFSNYLNRVSLFITEIHILGNTRDDMLRCLKHTHIHTSMSFTCIHIHIMYTSGCALIPPASAAHRKIIFPKLCKGR